MRFRRILLGVATIPGLAALAFAQACNGTPGPAATSTPDASDDSAVDASADTTGLPETSPPPDASNTSCKLSGLVTDPVGLCTQQQVLRFELQHAYVKGTGVAPGWSSVGPGFTALSGHAWQDDLGLAGSLGAYYCSAQVYGNNVFDAAALTTLADLGGILIGELQASPSPLQGIYDGEIYFRLRWAQAAYAYVDGARADALSHLADAFAANLAAQAYAVAPGGDGGDGGSEGGTVIGTRNTDGSVTYSPAQSVMAAAALFDLASRQVGDGGADPALGWMTTADQVLAYVLSRGKDPSTGLYYQSLTTSGDPGHDTPAPAMPSSDAMLTDTQAWVMLGLARAQALRDSIQLGDAGVVDGGPPIDGYRTAGGVLAGSLTAAKLFDGIPNPPNPPPPGAFLEGLVLSSGQLLSNKTTLGNAIALGGLYRLVRGGATSVGYEIGELQSALLQFSPAHSSLFTIVTDSTGAPQQQAYLRAGSRGYGYAFSYPVDAGTEEPGARNYRSDAVHATIEGLSQLWLGAQNDVTCAP